jgi:thiol-disulfide isomerase/thioredoxin
MLNRSNGLILGLAILAAAVGGYVEHRHQQPAPMDSALIGQPLPALALFDLDGKLHRLSDDNRGHRVLLNFWASWCEPCLKEMPALSQAQDKFGDHAPIVLGIAMDEPAHIRAFLAAHPVSYPILLGQLAQPSTSLQLGDSREVLPYSVLIDANGRILATHTGALSTSQLEQWLGPAHAVP